MNEHEAQVRKVLDLAYNAGYANAGGNNSLIDLEKNFVPDMFKGATIRVKADGVDYYRTVVSNTATEIVFNKLPGEASMARLGDVLAGEVTITTKELGVFDYTVEVVVSSGQNMELSSSFEDGVLTVYLGTDENGDPDNAKNTATAIATSIAQISEFNAEMTGAGGVIAVTEEPVEFSGGLEPILIQNGDLYQISSTETAAAPEPQGFEQLTIDDSVGGKALTEGVYGTATKAVIQVEGAAVRVTVDGVTAPTASVGKLYDDGDEIELESHAEIVNFRAIRTTAVSAILNVDYSS